MAVFILESLVLRGVAVLRDVAAVGLRLGTSYAADSGAPEMPVSMRHPSPGCRQGFHQPAGRPGQADLDSAADAVLGAGRSLSSRAGVPSRSLATHARSTTDGGAVPTAALRSSARMLDRLATVGEVTSRRLAVLNACTSYPRNANRLPAKEVSKRCAAKPAWCKPAGRTPPASTRGMV